MKPQIIDRFVYVKGKKISEVDNKTVLDGTEKVPLAQNDMNYSTTVDTISNYVDSVHDYLTTEDYNDLKGQIDSERTNRQEADNELNQSVQDTKSELHSTISNVESELLNEVSDLQEQIDNINNTGIANGVTLDTVQTINGEKTFTTVPKSTASAISANDLTNKNYVDTAISEALGDTISDVVTTNTAQEISGLKTFKTLPKGDGTPTAANDLVTKQYVDNTVANADVDLDGYATEAWVNEQGFAKTSDLPEGIEIGETTGTAFDGGRGKELEDTVATVEKRLDDVVLFSFDTMDLKNKTNSFLLSFIDVLFSSVSHGNPSVILQYKHVYDLNTDELLSMDECISSVVTVAMHNLDVSSSIYWYILYSNVHYSKANNRDQLIKITASFNFADEQNIQAEFQVEEVPVDLNSYNVINVSLPEDIANLNYSQVINIAEQMDLTVPNYISYGKYLCSANITAIYDDISCLTIKYPDESGIIYYMFGGDDTNLVKSVFNMPIHESISMILDGTIGYAPKQNNWRVILENHTLDVLDNFSIVNIVNDKETNTGKTISTDKLILVGNLGTYTRIRDSSESFYVPIISQTAMVQNDTLSVTYYAEIPQLLIQKHNLEYRYLDIICRRESTDIDTWGVYVKYRKDILASELGETIIGRLNNYLPLTGGTITGNLTVNGNVNNTKLVHSDITGGLNIAKVSQSEYNSGSKNANTLYIIVD